MRLIIFCNKVPDKTRRHMEREGYAKFRTGVWYRICRDKPRCLECMEELRHTLDHGSAYGIIVTERQWADMRFLTAFGG